VEKDGLDQLDRLCGKRESIHRIKKRKEKTRKEKIKKRQKG
jgi:hypothetical protein